MIVSLLCSNTLEKLALQNRVKKLIPLPLFERPWSIKNLFYAVLLIIKRFMAPQGLFQTIRGSVT